MPEPEARDRHDPKPDEARRSRRWAGALVLGALFVGASGLVIFRGPGRGPTSAAPGETDDDAASGHVGATSERDGSASPTTTAAEGASEPVLAAGVPPADAGVAALASAERDYARVRFAERYCEALAEAACAAAARASCAPEDCVSSLGRRCRDDVLSGPTSDDDQLIDEDRLAACVAESRALLDAGRWPLGRAPSCFRALVAPVALDARCGDADLLCADGAGHCDRERRCRRSEAEVPCDLDCGAGLACVEGRCRVRGAAVGEPCLFTPNCAPELLCVEGRCVGVHDSPSDLCARIQPPDGR